MMKNQKNLKNNPYFFLGLWKKKIHVKKKGLKFKIYKYYYLYFKHGLSIFVSLFCYKFMFKYY
jgi:hypothetical protein